MARSTMSKTIYMQQLGRGTRKCAGKTDLLVFDFVDNANMFNMPYSIHRLLNIEEYHPLEYVLAPDNKKNIDKLKDINYNLIDEISLLEPYGKANPKPAFGIKNLNVIEEATAYKSMLDKLHLTQEELAKKVGKSRSHITNIIGLLRLPDNVKDLLEENKITMGHARVLSKLSDMLYNIYNDIEDNINDMSVREILIKMYQYE